MDGRRFFDRVEAGQQLAEGLADLASGDDVVVCALPRGGVPVGFEVAQRLGAPLEVLIVRKLGVPGHEELAMGALASGGVVVRDEAVIAGLGIDEADFERVVEREQAELQRREHGLGGDRSPPSLAGRTVIVVDDGIATGSTMRAAVTALRQHHPARIVVATPVASHEARSLLRGIADEVRCLLVPPDLVSISTWYDIFTQTDDEEVRDLLQRSRGRA